MKAKIIPWLKGFLTAYAMRAVIETPLQAAWFEERTDYLTASVYALLGEYDFVFLFMWIACAVFFIYLDGCKRDNGKGIIALSAVFSLLIPIGQVLRDFGSLSAIYGSFVNVIITLLQILGFFLFFKEGLGFISLKFQKKNFLTDDTGFWGDKCFLKAFLILEAVYLIAVLLNFPGNLCYDTEGQMLQVLGETAYSTHHPLLVTLIMGLPVKLGETAFGSRGVGIFLYMLIQTLMLASALSFTVKKLSGTGLSKAVLWLVLGIYAAAPVYSNIASTAIKDVPFISAFIVYFVLLTELIRDKERLYSPAFMWRFVLFEALVSLTRKNGFYVVLLTGVVLWLVWAKGCGLKKSIVSACGLFIIATAAYLLISFGLKTALKAEDGHGGEAFSLPFQITARYINQHSDELTDKETVAIEAVLGDVKTVAERYDPELADAVKALYIEDAGTGAVIEYFKVWISMFFKHPGTYIEGFLVHTYGWYCPNVTAEVRYETPEDDFYEPTGVFALTDKVMIFVYRFLDRISLLGALENAGFYVWLFWFVTYLQKNKKGLRLMGLPLWLSLLVCFASPAFMNHTRYGFPIIMTMPYFTALTCALKTAAEDNTDD